MNKIAHTRPNSGTLPGKQIQTMYTHMRKSIRSLLLAIVSCVPVFCSAGQGSTITTVEVNDQSGSANSEVPITFGHVFAPGDVKVGQYLAARIPGGQDVPIQTDAKATHADGSLRHAVITLRMPSLEAGATKFVELYTVSEYSPGAFHDSPADLLETSYDVVVTLNVGGIEYTASAKEALTNPPLKVWLLGPLVREWLVMSPFKKSTGGLHPHLTARFDIRAYQSVKVTGSVRTDVTIENCWAYEPKPQGFTYDATISVAGSEVYRKKDIKHTHHARWHRVFWWGDEPKTHVKYDIDYLLKTGAVPIYDRRVKIAASALEGMSTAEFEPMSNGNITEYMPMTGGRGDIGPLPSFAAVYVLSMDARAKASVLANGGAGGCFHIHYRDKKTDLPVSLDDYPYMAADRRWKDQGQTYNPNTGQDEYFPEVTNGLLYQDRVPDTAHQPSIGYLPYLISGDYFYLEELQFWANWCMFQGPPDEAYRNREKGLIHYLETRGRAWTFRTLGQVAYITPDTHPLKQYFVTRVRNNLEPCERRSFRPDATVLGFVVPTAEASLLPAHYAWQDDFFTWAMGYLVQLGFTEAEPYLKWKSKFPVGRMTSPFCWLHAAPYEAKISTEGAPRNYFETFGDYYDANFTDQECSGYKMDGYPESPIGYGAILQIALATAVDAGAPGAEAAWERYETRDPKQDYSSQPQFAIVPKKYMAIPTITVTYPNGGGSFSGGQNVTITWTSANFTGNVKLEFYNGSSWSTIAAATANDGSESWTVPNINATGGKIRVSDAADGDPADESDSPFTISALVNSDGDGMSDAWEGANDFDKNNPADAVADADADGLTNLQEFQNGTNPRDADTDDDGLSDGAEVNMRGTNPTSADTDGDGMGDGWEVTNGLNPQVNDAGGDADGDGLTNVQEFQNGTNPHAGDTDGDGMNDGWEVSYAPTLNPTVNDSAADPDGDGYTNAREYAAGTDPTDLASKPSSPSPSPKKSGGKNDLGCAAAGGAPVGLLSLGMLLLCLLFAGRRRD